MAQVQNKKKRAVVAMSGGVDSSVAAALLARDGYEVVGVTMRLFNAPNENVARLNKSCCSLEDVEDARAVCRKIGAKHYFLNFEEEFQKHVVDYFVGEYERGRTPHPCLACNDRLKFEFLVRRAELMDADVVATGHYARIREDNGEYKLLAGIDSMKDQSYVLYTLSQEQLSKLASWTVDRRQARLPGHLLYSRRRLQQIHRTPPKAKSPRGYCRCRRQGSR